MKRFVLISLSALMALLPVSCKKEKAVDIEGLTVFPESIEMVVNEKCQLYVTLTPENAKKQVVQWSSDNSAVNVSETGVVSAGLFETNAVITARCGDLEAHCNVRVTVPVKMFGFLGALQSTSLAVGEEYSGSVVCNPVNATDRDNVVFENSDPSVADLTVNSSNPAAFTVKARKLGTTTITAKCGGKEAELFIYVDEVKATKITVTPATISLTCGESRHLTATVEPTGVTNKVSWTSLSPEVVYVKDGAIRALRPGTGRIVACCGDQTAYCDVTVSGIPDGAVDLGLSVFWAECNLGASSPEKPGNFYAWGELAPKSTYDWSNYKFYISGDNWQNMQLSRYNDSDGKLLFSDYDYEDDAARQTLGGEWRIPTADDFKELMTHCEMAPVIEKGKLKGVSCTSLVSGYTDRSIFFTINDFKGDDTQENPTWGMYWTSVLWLSSHVPAHAVEFHIYVYSDPDRAEPHIYDGFFPRCYGLNIRPVW